MTVTIAVRLSDEDYKAIEKQAKEKRLSLSAMVRMLALEALKK